MNLTINFLSILHRSIIAGLLLFFSCFSFQTLLAQAEDEDPRSQLQFTVSGGYGLTSMKEVNDDLYETYKFMRQNEIPASYPKDLIGGFAFGFRTMYKPSAFSFGLSVNMLSTNGSCSYGDNSGILDENYKASTIELTASAGYELRVSRYVAFFGRVSPGYGFASGKYDAHFEIYSDASYTQIVNHELSGGYFVGQVHTGIEFTMSKVFHTNLSIGYRMADAGALDGTMIYNDTNYGTRTVKDVNGNDIGFDYSGFTFGLEFSYILRLGKEAF